MKHRTESTPMKGEGSGRVALSPQGRAQSKDTICDPIRRFLPTPFAAPLPIMGRTVQMETNNSELLGHMIELFGRDPGSPDGSPEFFWRIVVEQDRQCSPPWPRRSTFSDEGIRFAQFDQRNFVAVDLAAREAVAVISEGLFEDRQGFTSPFVDTLFYMTAGSLRLVPFAAACVRSGRKGLLVLGPPNQGKTTASYLAAKDGLSFYADQSLFLEIVGSELRGWGDFVPTAFRPETLQYLPELETESARFSYCDFVYYYMRRKHVDATQPGFVVPTCCLVLERETALLPNLLPIPKSDFCSYLSESIAFKDDRQFDPQRVAVLSALENLPAYRLAYGSDPAAAAPFFRQLMSVHSGDGSTNDQACAT